MVSGEVGEGVWRRIFFFFVKGYLVIRVFVSVEF